MTDFIKSKVKMEKQTMQKIKRTVQLRREAEAKKAKRNFLTRINSEKLCPYMVMVIACSLQLQVRMTKLFSLVQGRQVVIHSVNAKHAELERRSVQHLRLKAVQMLRSSTQLVKSHADDLGLEYL